MPLPVRRPCAGFVLLALCVLSLAPAGAKSKNPPEPCPAGRFFVTAGADVLGATGDTPVVMDLPGRTVSFAGGCTVVRSRVRVLRRGTKLQVTFAGCGADGVRVRLKAAVTAACDAATGSLKPQRGRKTAFAAALSRCGDGVVDPERGEVCESGACGEGGTGTCVACQCQPPGGTVVTCNTVAVANEGWSHVPVESATTYAHNPPASGPHYPIWARYQEHTTAVPRGYWVHCLEHGAVVLLYRPDAGVAVIDALRAAFFGLPNDALCGGRGRALLTPDPLLDTPFSVVAANVELVCDQVDAQKIAEFVSANQGNAPEAVCVGGSYPP